MERVLAGPEVPVFIESQASGGQRRDLVVDRAEAETVCGDRLLVHGLRITEAHDGTPGGVRIRASSAARSSWATK
jgi:hypothetical protein